MSRKSGPNESRPEKLSDAGPHSSAEWTQHEHVAPPVQAQAQRLIDTAGSAGLARQAVNAAEQNAPSGASRQDDFARSFAFRSYLELFESSTGIRTAAGKNWHVTAVPTGGWIVWNDTDLRADGTFATRDEAIARAPSRDDA